uniref:Uncharacterized protein n=1 Tax=Lactuca sativa TaxID=4236 RepID=A0A9R1VAI9_LACSA|nr:hypothetical protein LSAT_V11C600333860 [Lactuca sativa]
MGNDVCTTRSIHELAATSEHLLLGLHLLKTPSLRHASDASHVPSFVALDQCLTQGLYKSMLPAASSTIDATGNMDTVTKEEWR